RVASRPLGLEDRDPLLERDTLARRGLHRPPAARRAVGLRDDADHIVPLAEQRPERRDREVRRAPEEDPHTTPTVRNASTIRLRLHLLPALQQHLPLERADPIDEEDAVQVVDLVLERTGQEPLGLDPDGPAVPVQPLDDDAGRALDDLLQPRDAETPLLVSLDLVARLEDDRIHEAERLDPRLPDIDDDDAAADPDLRRGEADAVRVVHRREHLVHQAPDLVVDLLDRLGLLPQDRVAEDPYLVYRHAAYDFASCVK